MGVFIGVVARSIRFKRETDTSAASLGFGANLQTEKNIIYNTSVQNFSDGFQANVTAFSNLTEVNNTLGTNVNVSMV